MVVHGRARVAAAAVLAAGVVLLAGCGASSSAGPTTTPPYVPPYVPPSTVSTPPAPPPPGPLGPRPGNGQVIVTAGGSGSGVLIVDNGASQDAYATLALGRQVIRGFYVQAGQKATISDVPDGTYDLYFASGSGWNSDLRQFTSNRASSKYDDQFPYTTSDDQYTQWTASLKPTIGGNAQTSNVSDADLPH